MHRVQTVAGLAPGIVTQGWPVQIIDWIALGLIVWIGLMVLIVAFFAGARYFDGNDNE